eukprot:10103732-Alexandrium_andersonii.AAC.1
MPEYASDFVVRLRDYIAAHVRIIALAPSTECDHAWSGLQELYGKRILPDRLRKVLNGKPGHLEHWCPGRPNGS